MQKKESVKYHLSKTKAIQEIIANGTGAEETMTLLGLSYSTHRRLMESNVRYAVSIRYARSKEGAKKINEIVARRIKRMLKKRNENKKPILQEVKIPPCEPMTCKSKGEHYFNAEELLVAIGLGILGGLLIGLAYVAY